jgi:hypothetical protein
MGILPRQIVRIEISTNILFSKYLPHLVILEADGLRFPFLVIKPVSFSSRKITNGD